LLKISAVKSRQKNKESLKKNISVEKKKYIKDKFNIISLQG